MMGVKVRGSQIYKASIDEDRMKPTEFMHEVCLPIVTSERSRTQSTLASVVGSYIWKPERWNYDLIHTAEIEIEYSSDGAGEADLYDDTNNQKLADLVTVTEATGYDVERIDVTSAIKALTSNTKLRIQIAGDGTNAFYIYKASLVITLIG